MGVVLQALEIIFQVKRKRHNEKIAQSKISFTTHKKYYFSLWMPPPFEASNFFISHSC
jgi:hypothetical protein